MSRFRPIHDAGIALSLLTVLPLPVQWKDGDRTGAAAWFPAVGLVVWGAPWATLHMLHLVGWRQSGVYAVAAGFVAIAALLTRMLHWDGLADVADAVWGGHTTERRLEIMADSHTGAFAATAVALVAVAQAGAVASICLGYHQSPLLAVPVLARLAATCAAWLGKPARPSGLGRSVMGPPTVAEVAVTGAVIGTVMWVFLRGYGPEGPIFVAAGIVLALAVPHLLSSSVGGVTGDIMGASILICETILFVTAAMLWGA